MSCCNWLKMGRTEYARFNSGHQLWMIQMQNKKHFYRVFQRLLHPFAAVNFAAAFNQVFDNEDDDDVKNFEVNLSPQQFIIQSLSQTVAMLPSTHSAFSFIEFAKDIQKKMISNTKFASFQENLSESFNSEANQNDMGAFKQLNKNQSFVHSIQLANNPMAMDEFHLSEVETVMSEYAYENDTESQISDNILFSEIDSFFQSSVDTSVL